MGMRGKWGHIDGRGLSSCLLHAVQLVAYCPRPSGSPVGCDAPLSKALVGFSVWGSDTTPKTIAPPAHLNRV